GEGDLDPDDGPDPSSLSVGSVVGKFGDVDFSGFGIGTISDFNQNGLLSIVASSLQNSEALETFTLSITYPGGSTLTTGTYEDSNGDCLLASLGTVTSVCPSVIFSKLSDADELIVSTADSGSRLNLMITSIQAQTTGGSVRGNFSGIAVDTEGNTVEIKDGAFNVAIN
ncbi:MAG: hypothetical protein AAF985_09260, partial [Bacteroidota bacterium]